MNTNQIVIHVLMPNLALTDYHIPKIESSVKSRQLRVISTWRQSNIKPWTHISYLKPSFTNENGFYKLFFKAIELLGIQKKLNRIFSNINLISISDKNIQAQFCFKEVFQKIPLPIFPRK
jgi:hypothetical protein